MVSVEDDSVRTEACFVGKRRSDWLNHTHPTSHVTQVVLLGRVGQPLCWCSIFRYLESIGNRWDRLWVSGRWKRCPVIQRSSWLAPWCKNIFRRWRGLITIYVVLGADPLVYPVMGCCIMLHVDAIVRCLCYGHRCPGRFPRWIWAVQRLFWCSPDRTIDESDPSIVSWCSTGRSLDEY